MTNTHSHPAASNHHNIPGHTPPTHSAVKGIHAHKGVQGATPHAASHKKAHTTTTPKAQKKKSHIFLIGAVTILFAVSAWGIKMEWQMYQLDKEKIRLQDNIKNIEAAIRKESENGKIPEKIKAKQNLEKAYEYRIEWSQIMDEIMRIEKVASDVRFWSLSTGRERKVSVDVSSGSMESAALLIEKISGDPKFNDPFIGGISGSNENGKSSYRFNFTFLFPDQKNTEAETNNANQK